MLNWDAWYSRLSRLTLDGNGRAGAAVYQGPHFSTYNEISDMVFRDSAAGILFGDPDSEGQAESSVLRCRFDRCQTGVRTANWNSMDVWVSFSRFQDCGRAIHNVRGNWHAWQNLFLRSTVADLQSDNLMVFSAIENTSAGSRAFFDFSGFHTWGSPVTIAGNRVLEPAGETVVRLDNAGPYLLMDNVFQGGLRMTWGDQILAGNAFSNPDAIEKRGRSLWLDTASAPSADLTIGDLPPTPPRRQRAIFEVRPGRATLELQAAVNAAAQLRGQRPVVHLAAGEYSIDSTVTIPAGADLQLIGDGAASTATVLRWTGPRGGEVLRLLGPSHATLRDFSIDAGAGRAIAIENADQAGGRVFADQLHVVSEGSCARPAAVRLAGLDRTDVQLRSLQGNGGAGVWVEAIGGPNAAQAANQISIFLGATGSSAGGQYAVRDGGRLVVRGVYHERSDASPTALALDGSGALTIDATRFTNDVSDSKPAVGVDGFRGTVTVASSLFMATSPGALRIESRGLAGPAAVLSLGNLFWMSETGSDHRTVWRNGAGAAGGLVRCNGNTQNPALAANGYVALEDQPGDIDASLVLRHLAPLRQARVWLPGEGSNAGDRAVTNVSIHRVFATGKGDTVVEIRSALASTSPAGGCS